MHDVNQTIVPDGLHSSSDLWVPLDNLEVVVQGDPMPTWDGPMVDRVSAATAHRLADAVDWFIEEGDALSPPSEPARMVIGDDDLPRLPVATTDETNPGPVSISLESEPEPRPEPESAPPRRGRLALLGLLAGGMLGVGGLALVGALGMVAVSAGAATVWLATAGEADMPAQAAATSPVEEEAVEGAAPEAPEPVVEAEVAPEVEAPVPAPEPSTVPSKAGSDEAPAAPVAIEEAAVVPPVDSAPEADEAPQEPRRSRPPIVRPIGSGGADASPSTVKLITQPPAARILVDGVDHGRTPLKLSLPAGPHTVVLEQGGVRSTLSVDVDAATDAGRFCFTASEGVFTANGCP